MPNRVNILTGSAPPGRPARQLDDLDLWLARPRSGRAHTVLLFCYYLAILAALLLIYGSGDFVTAPFVYQGF